VKLPNNPHSVTPLHGILKIFSVFREVDSTLRRRAFIGALLVALTIGCNILIPLLLRKLVEEVIVSNPQHVLLVLALSYASVWTLGQIVMQAREIISFRCIQRILRTISAEFFAAVHKMPLSFFVTQPLGRVVSVFQNAQEGGEVLVTGVMLYLLPTLLELLIACFVLSWVLPIAFMLIFLLMILFYWLFSVWALAKITLHQVEKWEKESKLSTFVFESLLNIETIQSLCRTDWNISQYKTVARAVEDGATSAAHVTESVRMFQGLILGVGLLSLMLLSVLAVDSGYLKVQEIVLINAYFLQLSSPLNHFSLILKDVKSGWTDLKRAFVLFAEPETKIPSRNARPLPAKVQRICLEDVSFGYEGQNRPNTLHGINFSLEKGTIKALIGETGSGKSTIAKLLGRFYLPKSGKIFLDNVNVNDASPEETRKKVAYLPQDPALFSGTIYDNLTYGNSNVEKSVLEEVLRKTSLLAFVRNLPQGLMTPVGERGLGLSGGERQRLALARHLLVPRDFYIFDEITSALDEETARIIQKTILSLKTQAGILLISHRLSMVAISDEIIFLSKGKIAERGPHKALLERQGAYAQLWKRWETSHLECT